MIESSTYLVLAIVLPFFAAAGINLLGAYKNIREVFQLICAAVLVFVIYKIYSNFMHDTQDSAYFFDIMPDIGFVFVPEPLGLLFAGLASILWFFSIIYSASYLRVVSDARQTRFFIYFALSIGTSIGLAFAGNLVVMFAFYELLTLVTYPLVVHSGSAPAKAAGRAYITYLLGASLAFLLPAIALIFHVTGSINFVQGGLIFADDVSKNMLLVIILLFVFGAAKAAIMPMHNWLPKAMVALPPVSGLLHAVAVVTAGVFVIGKVVIYVFGADNIEVASFAKDAVFVIASATIVISSIIALRMPSIKLRLAYSTIANLSYIILAFFILSKAGVVGAGAHMAAHALAKITLFFAAGAMAMFFGASYVTECNGLAKKSPVIFTCFLLCSLSIIGLPFFAGGYSKHLILAAASAQNLGFFPYLFYASMALNAAYLLPISYRAFFLPISGKEQIANSKTMQWVIAVLTVLTVTFPLYIKYITGLLEKVVI